MKRTFLAVNQKKKQKYFVKNFVYFFFNSQTDPLSRVNFSF